MFGTSSSPFLNLKHNPLSTGVCIFYQVSGRRLTTRFQTMMGHVYSSVMSRLDGGRDSGGDTTVNRTLTRLRIVPPVGFCSRFQSHFIKQPVGRWVLNLSTCTADFAGGPPTRWWWWLPSFNCCPNWGCRWYRRGSAPSIMNMVSLHFERELLLLLCHRAYGLVFYIDSPISGKTHVQDGFPSTVHHIWTRRGFGCRGWRAPPWPDDWWWQRAIRRWIADSWALTGHSECSTFGSSWLEPYSSEIWLSSMIPYVAFDFTLRTRLKFVYQGIKGWGSKMKI